MYPRLLLLLIVIGVGSAAGQAAELALDPLMSFISCLREVSPGYCLRERALTYFEKWITGDDDDDHPGNPDHDDDPGERLSPYWKTMVNSVAERIAGFYGEDEEEEGEKKTGEKKEGEERKSTELEGDQNSDLARGIKKKKKIKAIKKAIIKLVLIALLIKSKLKMLLTAFQTFLQFKAVLLATILVLIHAAKLWVEIKHKHHPQKVIYYENAHHQHHYDHHDDHHEAWDEHGGGGGGWSLWGRSGLEAPTTTPIYAAYLERASHDLPYAAHIPAKQ